MIKRHTTTQYRKERGDLSLVSVLELSELERLAAELADAWLNGECDCKNYAFGKCDPCETAQRLIKMTKGSQK